MNYNINRWKIGEDFVTIEEDNFSDNLNEIDFNKFIKSLGAIQVENNVIKNSTVLLQSYRDTLNYISQKCKVGALTDIENAVNKKLKK